MYFGYYSGKHQAWYDKGTELKKKQIIVMVVLVIWLIAGIIASFFITREKNQIVPAWRRPFNNDQSSVAGDQNGGDESSVSDDQESSDSDNIDQ